MMARSVRNLERLLGRLAALPDACALAGSDVLERNTGIMASRIRSACADRVLATNIGVEAAPSPRNTETAAQRVKAELSVRKLSWRVYSRAVDVIVPNHKYLRIHNPRWEEFGTAPHPVMRRTESLISRGGFRVKAYRRKTIGMHPGARRRPYFWPTVRAWKKPMLSEMRRAMNKAARSLTRL